MKLRKTLDFCSGIIVVLRGVNWWFLTDMSVHLVILTFKYETVTLSRNFGKKVRIEAGQDPREA